MKKLLKYNIVIIFLLIIFAVPILSAFNNKTISNIENRTLAAKPELTKERLLNGNYFSGWEEYMSDHIISRDEMIKSYTLLNMKILGKKKINNIIIGKENTLLPYYTDELVENLNNYLNNLPIMIQNLKNLKEHIKDNGGEFIFVGLPGQSSYFSNRYQNYFQNMDDYFNQNEKEMFQGLEKEKIKYINMNNVFNQESDDKYYLKTDHHFSYLGAYKTYVEIISKVKEEINQKISEPMELSQWNITTLEEPVLGSRNRQIYFLQDTDEKISIAYPKEAVEYEKKVNGVVDNQLYYINEGERPSYGVYMGGDHAEVIIDTNRGDLPNLLIFGDSFTNALEPLLFYHFNQTRILDLRHYKEMDLYEYIDKHKPDVVIMVRDDLNYGNMDGNGKFR